MTHYTLHNTRAYDSKGRPVILTGRYEWADTNSTLNVRLVPEGQDPDTWNSIYIDMIDFHANNGVRPDPTPTELVRHSDGSYTIQSADPNY